jgi:hypothetical protein
MGANAQGDRSLWSIYNVGNTTFDTKARLTSLLGARPDDYANSLVFANEVPLKYSPVWGITGSVKGVVGTTSDLDVFRLTVQSKNTYQITVSVPQFGDLDSQLVLYSVLSYGWAGTEYLVPITTIDPAIAQSSPYSGRGATLTREITAGSYAIGVRSHGDYGDAGGYTLTVSIPSTRTVVDFSTLAFYDGVTTTPAPPKPPLYGDKMTASMATMTMTRMSGGNGDDAAMSTPNATTQLEETTRRNRNRKREESAVREQIFAQWEMELPQLELA